LGEIYPDYYNFVFSPQVVQSLNGIAWWAVMLFVWIAGIELDLHEVWRNRRETTIAASLALGTPLLTGCLAALVMLAWHDNWLGSQGENWQFVVGIGMACSVTALPILILFMERIEILRKPLGQRVLRYASMDDIAIWCVLALIMLDWTRVGRQTGFLIGFGLAAWTFRTLMCRLSETDRWYVGLIWLALCGFAADWAGPALHGRSVSVRRSHRRSLVQSRTRRSLTPSRPAGCDAGVLPLDWFAHTLGYRRGQRGARSRVAAGRFSRWEIAGHRNCRSFAQTGHVRNRA
jgi:hypothetical protein